MQWHQRSRQIGGRDVDGPPHRVLANLLLQLSGQISGEWVGRLQHGVHQRAELRPLREVRHRRRHIGTFSRRHQRDLGDLVVQLDDLRLTAHPGRLGDADQAGVGRPPPGGIDEAVEVACVDVGRRRVLRHRGHRAQHRLLDHRAARRLPLLEPRHGVGVRDLRRRNAVRHRGLTRPASPQQP